MRCLVILAFFCCAHLAAHAGDIKPDDPSTPLLRFYVPKITDVGSDTRPAKADIEGDPVLVVHSVRDLILAGDNKGVMIGLTPADTKKFAALTRRFNRRYLIVLGSTDTAAECFHITAPIEDGYIGFKYPKEEAMAQYLRRRFRIAEFK